MNQIIMCHQCQQLVRWGVITQAEADSLSERIVFINGNANCSWHMKGLFEFEISPPDKEMIRQGIIDRGFPL